MLDEKPTDTAASIRQDALSLAVQAAQAGAGNSPSTILSNAERFHRYITTGERFDAPTQDLDTSARALRKLGWM